MKKTLLILLLLLLSTSFLIWHDKGNEYLKPYIATYLESQFKQDISIEVEHLKIDYGYVELTAILNGLTKVESQGEVSLLSKVLDIDYHLKSEGFSNKKIKFNNKIDINGTVIGTFDNMEIEGEGKTLQSRIYYALTLKNKVIKNINVDLNRADISELLLLFGQPTYAKGKVDIEIKIPDLETIGTKGKAKVILHKTMLNEKLFKEKLQIDLPQNTTLTATLNSKVHAEIFEMEGHVKSNLLWLQLSKATYNINSKIFNTNYRLFAAQLPKLKFLTQHKLRGQFQVDGSLNISKEKLLLKGKSTELGGEINFEYNGQTLNTQLNNVKISKLLYMLNEKPYATGEILANLKLDDIKEPKGTYNLKTNNAKTLHSTWSKEIAFLFKSKGTIASKVLKSENSLDSEILQYHSSDVHYDLTTKKLSSSYKINLPNLSKLSTLAHRNLQGKLNFKGTLNYDKIVTLTGVTNDLGGELNFKLQKNIINANLQSLSAEKLIYMLSYPKVFKGDIVGEFNYDLQSQQGSFISKLNKAQLLSNKLTLFIQQIRGIDLTKERYTQTHFNALLNKNIINIDFKAQSKLVLLAIPSGEINKSKNSINANYKVVVENKDIAGTIKGDIYNPTININSSNYLENKVIDIIKENIPEQTLKDLGLDKIKTEDIKNRVQNLLDNLFK